jgi:hypothetical protein
MHFAACYASKGQLTNQLLVPIVGTDIRGNRPTLILNTLRLRQGHPKYSIAFLYRRQHMPSILNIIKLRDLSTRVNYTDRATAACRRS